MAETFAPSSASATESGTFCDRLRAFNPFLDNRSNGPADSEVDVPAIHRGAFERLTGLCRDALTARRGLGAVLWGEAGIGKSHLLARLGRWARQGNACFVYLHNLQAFPEQLPHSVLHSAVSILTLGRRTRLDSTPLFELVRASVHESVGHDLRFHSWPELERDYQRWVDAMGARGLIDRQVYEVLYRFFRSAIRAAQGKEDGASAALAVRWLAGQGLDPDEARLLGLPPGRQRDEPVAVADAQQVKQVLVALTRLALCQGRPFVLAFDQVDNLEQEQFASLARFLEALIDSSPNLLAVTAGIQSTILGWRERRVVQDSAWDRVAQFAVALQRLTPAEARAVVKARLDGFLAPFPEVEAVERLRGEDDLFPLGRGWEQRFLAERVDVRPRDAINWAGEGWRAEQSALARLGDEQWLASWQARQTGVGERNGREPTREEVQAAVDRKVSEWITDHCDLRKREPGGLPPDGAHLVGLLHGVLEQFQTGGQLYGVCQVERVPEPRKGARPSYDLALRRLGEDHRVTTTGILVLTASDARSATAFLRRLLEGARPLDRVVVVTDERVGLPLGARGEEYLEDLRALGTGRFGDFELTVEEYAELEALRVVVQQAKAGELEVEERPGRLRPVSAEEVHDSLRRQGRYLAHPLLRELLSGAEAQSR